MIRHPKRPKDANELAKLVVDLATGEAQEQPKVDERDPAAVALGKKGGLKGGKARAKKLTEEQRREIASNAANRRWNK